MFFIQGSINQWHHQWHALDTINKRTIERETLASDYLNALKKNNLKTLVSQHRKSLQAFNQAIRSRTSSKQLAQFAKIEYAKLFAAFPIWLVSLNSLHKVLPLNSEMFDLVIIDEATQCNISSCLPALYRAKRALIVGDTKQLKHYSFLARAKQNQLLSKNNVPENNQSAISYRDNSILDLALKTLNTDKELAFLDEHFRSKPELIHFSNQSFYHSRLKVMQHRPCTSSGHLHLHRLKGIRDTSGVNHQEAQCILADIQAQITTDNNTGIAHSIGVISPFSAQAEQIAALIEKHIPQADIIKHNIRAATPFGFQGEERDIMLISFAIDNNSKHAAAYLNKADVFNVTITRARQKQSLYLSIDDSQLPENNLLRCYIASMTTFHAEHSVTSEIDAFQQQIIAALQEQQIETWPGYAIVGTEIDILCRYANKYLAIDLIGFPGPWANFFELTTYRLFERAGVEILPLSYGLWVVDKQACIDKIKSTLLLP
ncbi:DEAD/DEAH box helicase [Shewanella sp. SG44-6]|uniref:DEAD/DEAH box helicase n=1 Tax=Shewanella sp. SG44-6 TaxID=2760959 RepID=UPI0021758E14|nr:DEAD/DEAH box helicase [Shewanella sp. SG44-6]